MQDCHRYEGDGEGQSEYLSTDRPEESDVTDVEDKEGEEEEFGSLED